MPTVSKNYRAMIEDDHCVLGRCKIVIYRQSGEMVTTPVSGLTTDQANRFLSNIAYAFEAGYLEAILEISRQLYGNSTRVDIVYPEDK